jgi:hypothetical protein
MNSRQLPKSALETVSFFALTMPVFGLRMCLHFDLITAQERIIYEYVSEYFGGNS